MKQIKMSDVFREAAELLVQTPLSDFMGACGAIEKSIDKLFQTDESRKLHYLSKETRQYFHELFKPIGPAAAAYYFSFNDGTFHSDTITCIEARQRRVQALLFAAEIAKSERL